MKCKKIQSLFLFLFVTVSIMAQCPISHSGIITDISKYTIVSSEEAIEVVEENDELSGVTFDYISRTMVAISDENYISAFKVNNSGIIGDVSNLDLTFDSPSNISCTDRTRYDDPEAIAHDGRGNRFLIAEERKGVISFLNFNPLGNQDVQHPGFTQTVRLTLGGSPIACNNEGIEGMVVYHHDFNQDFVIVAKQRNESKVYYFDMPGTIQGQDIELQELFDINTIQDANGNSLPEPIYNIHGLTRVSGGSLMILASIEDAGETDDGKFPRVIIETTPCGVLLSYINLDDVISDTDELEGIAYFPPEDDQVAIALVGETIGSGSRLIILNKDTDGDGVADINDPNQNDPCIPVACTNVCSETTIDFENFDGGWGIWNDGGSDARRNSRDINYANSGTFCARLRDNSNTSMITTDNLNLGAYESVRVEFSYVGRSMDNTNEDFWFQVSTNGGSTYTSVEEWNRGDEFQNNIRETGIVEFDGPFTSNTKLRIKCDASTNTDWVYVDDVKIIGCSSSSARTTNNKSVSNRTNKKPLEQINEINIYPNPVSQLLTIETNFTETQKVTLDLVSAAGQLVKREKLTLAKGEHTNELNVTNIPEGIYYIKISNEEDAILKKVSIIH